MQNWNQPQASCSKLPGLVGRFSLGIFTCGMGSNEPNAHILSSFYQIDSILELSVAIHTYNPDLGG